MKQKTQAILGVLTSIFVKYGGKYSVKIHACDLISGYLRQHRTICSAVLKIQSEKEL